ncbi:phage tail sheath family protein [Escherichia sp. E1130]|uniref:phage tail sheath family protein n=1 Tax=Escherichia sp. E1130 TaxID=2041645 RepID=UPI001436AB2D|nr:phage tail sheath family protein [Escherichia sp. E1130]
MQMQLPFPGVAISESWLTLPAAQDTAVPVFAGFISSIPIGVLYEVYSYEQFSLWAKENDWEEGTVLPYALRLYFDNGGRRCFVLSLGSLGNGEILKALTAPEAWQAVKQQKDITLLSVPDSVLLDDNNHVEWLGYWQHLLELAQECRAHALLDAPSSPTSTQLCLEMFSGLNAECGSVYWPRLKSAYQYHQPEGRLYNNKGRLDAVFLPPSAVVAAVVGKVDRDKGVWSAPANVPLYKIIQPEYTARQGSGLFQCHGRSINLIRSFPLRGCRIWGCRTLSSEVEYDWRQYIQTRRTLLYIQQSLVQLCHFSVFEPNTQITWLKMKGLSLSWLNELWLKGGLMGRQEQEAFYVNIGLGESMTAHEVAQGQLSMEVGVALHCPAEFITLRLQFAIQQEKRG